MKKLINISLGFLFLAGMSSCLKEKTIIGPDSPGAVKHVIEFKNPATLSSNTSSKIPVYRMPFDRVATEEFNLEVNYAGAGNAPNDIKVKVVVDQQLAAAAIREQQEDIDLISSSYYSLSSTELTIPKGQKTASIKVTVHPEKFVRTFYALGFKIESISGTDAPISGNFGKIVTFIGTKNKYDGEYLYNSTTSLGNIANAKVKLLTAGDYKVKGNLINTYSNEVWYAIDPVTNKVTVSMVTLLPIATDPTSFWDPETETLYAKWTSNGGARTFTETYKKQ